MKALFAVFLSLFFGMVSAEEIKIVNGEVMLIPSNLVATGVKVAPEAEKYPMAVAEVFRDKTNEVAVKTKYEIHVINLFHYKEHVVQVVGVKYDVASNTIGVTTEPKVLNVSGDHFFWFPILWIMGILAMVASNVLLWRKKNIGAAGLVIAIVLSAVVSISGSIDFLFTRSAVVFVTFLVALLTPVVVINFLVPYNDGSKLRYDLLFASSVVYYASMVVLARMVYYPSPSLFP